MVLIFEWFYKINVVTTQGKSLDEIFQQRCLVEPVCWSERIIFTWALESQQWKLYFFNWKYCPSWKKFHCSYIFWRNRILTMEQSICLLSKDFSNHSELQIFFSNSWISKSDFCFLFSNDHVIYWFCYVLVYCTDKSHVKNVELLDSWNVELMDSWNVELMASWNVELMDSWNVEFRDWVMKCWIFRWSRASNELIESWNVEFWDWVMKCWIFRWNHASLNWWSHEMLNWLSHAALHMEIISWHITCFILSKNAVSLNPFFLYQRM